MKILDKINEELDKAQYDLDVTISSQRMYEIDGNIELYQYYRGSLMGAYERLNALERLKHEIEVKNG